MDGEQNELKTFSYPNADRPLNDTSETMGVLPSQPEQPVDRKLTQQELRHTVHLNDALTDEASQKPSDLQNIKTFQSDVANAVRTDNMSLIKIALAEKKRQERQGTYDSVLGGDSASKNRIYVTVGAIALLLIGGGVFLWAAFRNTNVPAVSTQTPSITTPVFAAEKTVNIDIRNKDSNDIERLVKAEKINDLPLGSIERLKFVSTNDTGITQELSSQDWLTFFQARVPDSLSRSFEPGFIFGIYSLTPKQSFIILKLNSYDNAYAGMLQWEPFMDDDIGAIVEDQRPPTVISDDTSTTTTTTQFNGKAFVDRVLDNKDTRVLLDDNGNIKLLYTFFDKNTLIIASGESALKEVLFRLTTGRISR